MTPLKESSACIIEIQLGAAPIREIYIDGTKEMLTTVMIKRAFFGPLVLQEIKELVIAQYQKTLSWNGITIKGNGKEKYTDFWAFSIPTISFSFSNIHV